MKRVMLLFVLFAAGCLPAAPAPTVSVLPTEPPFYAPDFTMSALDGGTVTLSALRGRWVILNFWATWCAPCVAEMPALQHIADEYADRATLLGVNMREDRERVAAFIQTLGIRYPILIDPPDAPLVAYNVMGLPQTLIIAPDGEVVWRSFGEIEVESFSAQLTAMMEA